MNFLISISLAIIPTVFLVTYFYKQDKRKPEPKDNIILIFLLGFFSIFPVIVLEIIVKNFALAFAWTPLMVAFIEAFIVAALCEEWMKLQIVKRFVYKDSHFDEVMDGVVYAIVASMGFACLENILYVRNGDIALAIARGVTAVPGHAIFSGLMGFYIGRAKFAKTPQEEKSFMMKGLMLGVLIHGLYDFFLFADSDAGIPLAGLVIPLLVISYLYLKKQIKMAIADDEVNER